MFHYAFEYFRWFCPTSGGIFLDSALPMPPGSTPFRKFPDADILDYILSPIKANPDLPFFLYAASGGPMDGADMREQMKLLTEQPCFSYGKDSQKTTSTTLCLTTITRITLSRIISGTICSSFSKGFNKRSGLSFPGQTAFLTMLFGFAA